MTINNNFQPEISAVGYTYKSWSFVDSFALLAAILQAIPELFRASKETSYVSIATSYVSIATEQGVSRPCWKFVREQEGYIYNNTKVYAEMKYGDFIDFFIEVFRRF